MDVCKPFVKGLQTSSFSESVIQRKA